MDVLIEIHNSDVGYETVAHGIEYTVRKASRAIVVNQFNQVAILYVSKKNYHKLPGGGAEQNESLTEALIREVLEEVGAEINIVSEVGRAIEYRDRQELMQESYCYIAKVSKLHQNQSFTEEELHDGFILKWVPLEQAVALLQDDRPSDYTGAFIQKRDYSFLTKAVEHLMNA